MPANCVRGALMRSATRLPPDSIANRNASRPRHEDRRLLNGRGVVARRAWHHTMAHRGYIRVRQGSGNRREIKRVEARAHPAHHGVRSHAGVMRQHQKRRRNSGRLRPPGFLRRQARPVLGARPRGCDRYRPTLPAIAFRWLRGFHRKLPACVARGAIAASQASPARGRRGLWRTDRPGPDGRA
jgi:hypothetical protein